MASAVSSDRHDVGLAMLDHKVFFILRDFTGDLWALSRGAHVWLVHSPANAEAAHCVRGRETGGHSPLSGVTTFASSGDCLADFYRFLETIDEHHNENSAAPPWRSINVRGVPVEQVDADRIRDALDCDHLQLLPESGGFAIVRVAQYGAAADDRPRAGDRG